MQTTESCMLCEKVAVVMESDKPLDMLLELPNTFDTASRRYTWKHYDIMAYAIVPRAIHTTTGHFDLYMCIDEDDLDDIDLFEYAKKFLFDHIFSRQENFHDAHLFLPCLASPDEIGCCRLHHESQEGKL